MFFCKIRWFFESWFYRLGFLDLARRLDLQPDEEDGRDFIYQAKGGSLPEAINLSDLFSPVEDQGNAGSCTANAVVGVLEFYKRQVGSTYDLSRRFLYWVTRRHECTMKDRGATIRSAIKMAKKFGVPREIFDSYDIARLNEEPSLVAYADAKDRVTITSYKRVKGGAMAFVSAIADAKPVVFGVRLRASFLQTGESGIVPFREGLPIGNHAMVAVGYSLSMREMIVRNSWGEGWGQGGYCRIPFTWFDDSDVVFDAWIMETRELPEDYNVV